MSLLLIGQGAHIDAYDKVRSTLLAMWRSGGIVGSINEVTLRRSRLALGWVTAVYHFGT